jgi:polyphosphate kinase
MCAEAARAPLKLTDLAELNDPSHYLNRELSHLEFQRRVLEEARDRRNPLLERVKFLSIFASNIDEFFMVRVAGVLQQIENGVQETGLDGRGPSETLDAVRASVARLVNGAYDFLREELLPALEENQIRLLHLSELSIEQRAARHVLRRQSISRSDAVGLRSRPPVPAYLEPEPEYRGSRARARRRR